MRKLLPGIAIIAASLFSIPGQVQAQEKWDLQKCVNYALQNNISVKQADLQARFAALDYKQARLNIYPNIGFSTNLGVNSGRNQNPANFDLVTETFLSHGYSLQAGVDLFNWFSKRNTVKARDLSLQATIAGIEKAQNDVALNVATAYLQILLSMEQVNIARVQLAQTTQQLENTRLQVDAGKLPELNATQLEAQLATDSSAVITARASVTQTILQMKALLNLDAAAAFDVLAPPVETIPVESLADLQPENVFSSALIHLPQQKVNKLNLQAAQKNVLAAKGAMYPTLSMFGSLGSRFINTGQELLSTTQTPVTSIGKVTVNGTEYSVAPNAPLFNTSFNYAKQPYFSQINQNFQQSVGLSLSVPIFNNGTLRNNWQRSKLNVKQVELQMEQDAQTIKQDIYTAHNDAVAALEKYNANQKSVAASEKAYDFAKKRYDMGLLSTYDLLNTQNALATAKYNLLYAQYDYVFKIKLLEFYKGQGLKL
ncbi:TolC family protein [Terrimonas rubra]|uniref:TolC family protein n=1 Tax=Terrimonas rubra TaxID=1035890 RepID=A0ABW6A601_9BACT